MDKNLIMHLQFIKKSKVHAFSVRFFHILHENFPLLHLPPHHAQFLQYGPHFQVLMRLVLPAIDYGVGKTSFNIAFNLDSEISRHYGRRYPNLQRQLALWQSQMCILLLGQVGEHRQKLKSNPRSSHLPLVALAQWRGAQSRL